MKELLGKVIALIILAAVVIGIIVGYMTLGSGLAGFLGVQCQSYGKLMIFLLIYFILQHPIELVGKTLSDVLKEFDYIREDSKIVQATTIIIGSIIVMATVDYFMKSVYMKDLSIIVFCIIQYFIESIIEKKC